MWQWLIESWPVLVGIVDVVLAACAMTHAVLLKRDSRAVIGWVGLIWLAPFLGSLAYFCFGINRIERKASAMRLQEEWRHEAELQLTPADIERRDELVLRYPNLTGLVMLGHRLTSRPVLPGNRVEPLVDGDEAYPAMLQAIDQAERSVTLVSYIFDSDRAGAAFREALLRAHRRGVQVRVLIDDVGSRYSRPNMVRRLRGDGLTAASFLPTRVPRFFKYANLRNHRKILVADGRIGFTGGTNVREGHWLSLQPAAPVKCVHFRIEGPVVRQMQETFAIDWCFATGESLQGEVWFPVLSHSGPVFARGIPDGPDEDFEKMTDTLIGALAVATDSVRIMTPYFLPSSGLIQTLNVAAMRGVDVRIHVPEQNNIRLAQWASIAQMWQLIAKGCRVFLTPPPFDHTKLLVVDDVWSLIGSTNWDPRSLRLNFEFNVECYDDVLANQLTGMMERKESVSRELTLDELNGRSFPVRLRDGLARLFTPYL